MLLTMRRWLRRSARNPSRCEMRVRSEISFAVKPLRRSVTNPVRRVVGGETLRRRVDVADQELDFPILHDLKAQGATDYFALPIKSSFGTNYMATYDTHPRHLARCLRAGQTCKRGTTSHDG